MDVVSSFYVFFEFSKFIDVPVYCQDFLFPSAAFPHKERP